MNRLENKVAIITGAAGYLGSATAKLFAAEGCSVVCADIADDRLAALVDDITAAGGVASAVRCDVTVESEIKALVDRSVEMYGRLDILHNNATGFSDAGPDGNVLDTPDAVWDFELRINLYAPVWGCRHAIPRMIETGGGSIVNMASMLYSYGQKELMAMGVSKAAVVSLTRYIASAHGKDGIRANTISPGFTMSPEAVAELPKIYTDIHLQHALTPRLGQSIDQAHTALFLASDESSFMTGQVLHVDGGLTVHNPTTPQVSEALGRVHQH